ncbi:MAG: type II secretion system protein GspG [Phycisphaerales bacterium]
MKCRTSYVAVGTIALCVAASGGAEDRAAHEPKPYMRVVDDGGVTRLEMAVRKFEAVDGAADGGGRARGPVVYFAAAVHIAEGAFYRDLQGFLDAQDVVLFESVKPAGAGDARHDGVVPQTDEARRKRSEQRVRFVGVAVERFRMQEKRYPKTLDEIAASGMGRMADLLKSSSVDAWGNAIVYTLVPATAEGERARVEVVSLGADGRVGGDGIDADLRLSDQKPLNKSELGDRSKGIQQRLADALEVEFQLTAMHHDRANWRNSDLSIDQVEARLEQAGADGGMLFSMLDGSSMGSKLAGFLIGLLGSTPESRAMLRVAMIETIGRADALFAGLGGEMGALMEVIVVDRNTAVLTDLRAIIENEPGVKSVAIIYGGGHLPDLERRLVREFGYSPAGDEWRTAMRVDAKAAGLTPGQLTATRKMIGSMLEAQTKRAKKK